MTLAQKAVSNVPPTYLGTEKHKYERSIGSWAVFKVTVLLRVNPLPRAELHNASEQLGG